MMEYVLLNNNVKMPKLGYGVFQVSNEECERCVLDAISVGYRAIDTAQSYGNVEAVGNAIQKCGVPREELFLTSKIWMSNASYEKAKASIDKSLHKLKHMGFHLIDHGCNFCELTQIDQSVRVEVGHANSPQLSLFVCFLHGSVCAHCGKWHGCLYF